MNIICLWGAPAIVPGLRNLNFIGQLMQMLQLNMLSLNASEIPYLAKTRKWILWIMCSNISFCKVVWVMWARSCSWSYSLTVNILLRRSYTDYGNQCYQPNFWLVFPVTEISHRRVKVIFFFEWKNMFFFEWKNR